MKPIYVLALFDWINCYCLSSPNNMVKLFLIQKQWPKIFLFFLFKGTDTEDETVEGVERVVSEELQCVAFLQLQLLRDKQTFFENKIRFAPFCRSPHVETILWRRHFLTKTYSRELPPHSTADTPWTHNSKSVFNALELWSVDYKILWNTSM